jgi:hypothetical protein
LGFQRFREVAIASAFANKVDLRTSFTVRWVGEQDMSIIMMLDLVTAVVAERFGAK